MNINVVGGNAATVTAVSVEAHTRMIFNPLNRLKTIFSRFTLLRYG